MEFTLFTLSTYLYMFIKPLFLGISRDGLNRHSTKWHGRFQTLSLFLPFSLLPSFSTKRENTHKRQADLSHEREEVVCSADSLEDVAWYPSTLKYIVEHLQFWKKLMCIYLQMSILVKTTKKFKKQPTESGTVPSIACQNFLSSSLIGNIAIR